MSITKYNLLWQICVILLGSLCTFQLSAQKVITGSVTDVTTGEALIGATIVVKDNTSTVTITDFDGNFSLKVGELATTLVFSYTGYSSQEIVIDGQTEINAALSSGQILEDVVVIGYGTVKREDATGAVQSVTTKQFNQGAIAGPQQLLAGKVAGVTITTDPSPGGGASILIRGLSSLGASNAPLIVVDGVPIDGGGGSGSRNPLNVVNPNDIESMTVLKDASATAIYGSRASGGVILITTKSGSLDSKKISLTYSGNVATASNTKQVDVLNADEFRSLMNERFEEGDAPLELLGDANTDWQDEIYRNAIMTDHSLSASGAVGFLPYRASVGYTDHNGVLKTDRFNRFTTALSLTPGFIDNTLQLKMNFKSMHSRNNFADRGAIGNALSFDPTKPVMSGEDVYNGFTTWTSGSAGVPNQLAPKNPVALLTDRDDRSNVNRYLTSLNADYRLPFLPALRANVNVAYDYINGGGSIFIPQNSAIAFNANTGGGVDNSYESTSYNTLLETYLNYIESYGIHDFDIMGGYSWQRFFWDSNFRNSDVNGTPTETLEDSNQEELYLVSLFGRVNYNINDRVFTTFTLRRDGTSRFSPESRWGLFPAASLAVKVIDNKNNYFSNLKVRAGWGVTGQQNIGNGQRLYAYQGLYQYGFENAQYQFGDQFVQTIRPNGYDENIKWEETSTYNIAADFSIIRNKLSGSIDIYQRLTKDLLNTITVPAGSNLTNEITTNIGNMENRGIEIALNYTPIEKENFTWDINANMAYNENKVTKLTASDDPDYIGILTGGIAGGVGSNIQIHTVGFSPNSFFVFEQEYDDDGNILEGQFVDRNEDGIVNDDDKYRFENPFPDYTFGITNNMNIGSFDFSFAGRANLGQFVYANVETDMGYKSRISNLGALWNVHQAAIDNNVEQQANLTFSDHYLRSASFFRLDHITAGYDFNKLTNKNIRVYVSVQNPLVLTSYTGLDPEIQGGIDNNIYPRTTNYLFGVNATF